MNYTMKKWIYLFVLFFASGCGYNDFADPTPGDPELPVPSMRISTLRSLYRGTPVALEGEEITVMGRITTSDFTNNFYRTFMVEDETGAVEIRAGLYDLHAIYRRGQRVIIKARGLSLGMSDGLLQLGLHSYSPASYEVEYIDARPLLDRYVVRTELLDDEAPLAVPLPALTGDMVGRLVRIDGLRIDYPSDTTWAVPASLSPSGLPRNVNLLFRQTPADSIFVYTSGYANFAGERVPRGAVGIVGILLQGKVNGKLCYQLKMRDMNDVYP